MARVRDLWHDRQRRKTARHPDRGGNKNARRWLAIWTDPDGRECSKAFRLEDAAKKYGNKMEADVERGEYIDPKAGRELFGAVAAKYLRLRKVGGSSHRTYDSVYRNHVGPAFAERSVKSIRPSEVAAWLQGPLADMSESVQATAYLIVQGPFELAIADKMRRDNPARSKIIDKPKPRERARKAWTTDTLWLVINAHPEPYRAIILAEAGLGLRQGEALGLAEEDIDFGGEVVNVRRQLIRQGDRFVFKMPKGEKERTVPLSRGMAQALRAHIAAYPPQPYSLPWMDDRGKLKGTHACGLMFRWHGDDRRTRDRHVIPASYDRMVWKPALHAAGLIGAPVKGDRGIMRYPSAPLDGQHAARHWYSVALQDGGVSLVGVMEFMGHSLKGTPVTLAVYGHVTAGTLERARTVIDADLFRLRAVKDTSSGTVAELRKAT